MLEIRYHPQVKKDLRRISPEWRNRIREVIHKLAQAPEMGKHLQGRLDGMRSYRAGNYRIVYMVKPEGLYVLSIGHRRDVYAGSSRRTP